MPDIENTENPRVMTKNKEKGLEFKRALVAHCESPSDGYGIVCCEGYSGKCLVCKHSTSSNGCTIEQSRLCNCSIICAQIGKSL